MIIGDLAGFFPTFPGLKELTELYKELDLEADRFKRAAGLACLEWCKKCCSPEKAQIEASVFECLPLAVHLWKRGEAEPLLQRIPSDEARNLCALHNPDDSCRPAKDADPQTEERTNRELARGLKPMVISPWARRSSFLNPYWGQKRHPINLAVRSAPERVGFQLHLLQAGGDKNLSAGQEDFKEMRAENRFY